MNARASLEKKKAELAGRAAQGKGIYRQSAAQARLWFLDRFQPGNSTYNIPWSMRLPGPLDLDTLERALGEIVRRHGALRTTFGVVDGSPVQIVDPLLKLKLDVVDLTQYSAPEREAEAQRLTLQESSAAFDLSVGPLIHAKLLRLSSIDHVLVLVMHHIVSDGWSINILYQELSALYPVFLARKPSPLPEPRVQYAVYSEWLSDWLTGERLESHLAWWRRQLQGLKGLMTVPSDRQRPPLQSHRGELIPFTLDARLTEDLKELGKSEGATLFMTLLAAFQVLIGRYTGKSEAVVGSPIANRPLAELEGTIGLFVNTLVMRVDLSGDPTFRQLLRRVREMALGAYAHQEMPFERLVEELQPERDLGHNPLFQILFAVQNIGATAATPSQPAAPMPAAPMAVSGTSKFDLTVTLFDTGRATQAAVEYCTDLYDATTITCLIERYRTLLRDTVDDPDRRISQLAVEPDRQLRQFDSGLTSPPQRIPPARSLGEMLAANAVSNPGAIALIEKGETVTYGELNRRVSQMAGRLLKTGLRPGEAVGVAMDRSIASVVALLAVAKAGGVFVPIDLLEPAERARQIASDAGIRIMIAGTGLRDRMPPAERTIDPHIDDPGPGTEDEPNGMAASSLALGAGRSEVVAILYRSGNSGKPIGIKLSHESLLRSGAEPALEITPADRIAHASSFLDDAALFEVFGALANGAAVVCLPTGLAPRPLAEQIRDHQVTILHTSLSSVERLGKEFPWAFRRLRAIFCPDAAAVAARLHEGLKRDIVDRLFVISGSLETGGAFATQSLADLSREEDLPLGQPAAGVTIHLLDGDLRPVPEGLYGEIYVGASHLSPGYHNLSDATSEKWIGNPFGAEPAILFATGDFARRRKDGFLSFATRHDGRSYVRGVRIESAEIEAALLRHPAVSEAVAIAAQPLPSGLAAFVVAAGAQLEPGELKEKLRDWLPAATIPSTIELLDEMPREGNGDPDRRALTARLHLAATARSAARPHVAPRNPLEERIARIWMQIFRLERVGVHDNFFQLGGHSLLATQVIARIADELGVDVPLHRLFDSPTIAEIAAIVEPAWTGQEVAHGLLLQRVSRDQPMPLSYSQERVWFLDQFEPDTPLYNTICMTRLPVALAVPLLQRSVNELIRRHETLRTTFAVREAQPVQVVAPELKIDVKVVDLSSYDATVRETEMLRAATLEAQQPFHLGTGPLLRACLFRLAESDHVLLLVIHHIVSDARSLEIVSNEIAILYDALQAGRSFSLPELSFQYADFAVWQRQYLGDGLLVAQLAYWKDQLQGAPAVLELPTDRPRPPAQSFRGGLHSFRIPQPLTAAVRRTSEQHRSTVFMTLLAAFDALLYRYTGQADFVVGTPIANRARPELEGVVGFFVNTLPLRARITPDLTFQELLSQVREVTLAAYEHQDIPFEKLVEELHPERNLSYNPLFQVMLAFQSEGKTHVSEPAPDADSERLTIATGIAKFDLTLFVTDTGTALHCSFEYNSDLFDEETVVRMSGHFETLLAGAMATPNVSLAALPILQPHEGGKLAEWNATGKSFQHSCLQQMFEQQVARTPHSAAVLFDSEIVSYRDLNEQANSWANRLLEDGIGSGARVAVAMERSVAMVVAVLAILKAGAAYVPIDPAYPPARIALMLTDAGVRAILATEQSRAVLPASDAPVLLLENGNAGTSKENPAVAVSPDDPAYVIYTSGSTGRPKGVVMPHRTMANLVEWQIRRSALPLQARTIQFAPLSFDVSCQEIFSTLCCGGTLVLISENARRDPSATYRLLAEAAINRLYLPYVALQQIAEYAATQPEMPQSLTEVITAGEQLHVTPAIAAFFRRLQCPLYNQYGPTESHVVTEECLHGDPGQWLARPTIGRPIQNAQIWIRDKAGQPQPVGIPGEIYIGGLALASGYWQRDDLTVARFVESSGQRQYRTGDRGRYLPDGRIEFLGREDDQLKVRGFRVEPGEIETHLRRHPAIQEAVVLAGGNSSSEAILIAYVQSRPNTSCTESDVQSYLGTLLPSHMLPSVVEFVAALPLTPSGKVDRRALSAPNHFAGYRRPDAVAPRTEIETAIANIWCDILRLPSVGIRDNFFALGGQSLLATRMVTRLNEELQTTLPLRRAFETPTIESLAASVAHLQLHQDESIDVGFLGELEALSEEEARELLENQSKRAGAG